jgi:hypothetical protein
MLTKEQIANLSIDQQETLATVELRRACKRQALLDEIRGLNKPLRWAWKIVVVWILFLLVIYYGLEAIKHSATNIMFAAAATSLVNLVTVAYMSPIWRRLNALVELLEHDGVLEAVPKRPQESKPDAQN